jgi:hypothetical protein
LITVAAADASFLVNHYISPGQLGNGPDRTDAGAGRLNAMLASPVFISPLLTVFGIGPEIDHNPILGGKIRFPVGHQFVSLHLQFVPAFAGRHTPLAANASGCVHQFAVT